MDSKRLKELEDIAKKLRISVIEMLAEAGSGHIAGPLGMADIFAALYFHILKHNPDKPDWDGRDYLILSNGHIVPIQYASLAYAGYFPVEELTTLRKAGSRLQGHPEKGRLPGIETTSGPLGCGLGQAAGIAYGLKMDKKENYVYCIMSDGEQDEGNIWESAMFAAKNKLDNLIGIIDRNNIQLSGMTEEIMPLEPLSDKYESFGWNVIEINGHKISEFIDAVEKAKGIKDEPTVIIANTVPGKGVKEIEHDFKWHGKVPTKEQAVKFIEEIENG